MPRVTNTKQPVKKQNNKKAFQPSQTSNKVMLYTVLGILLIGIGALTYWLVDTYVFKDKEQNYDRFETLEHIVLDEYKWLLNDNEEDALEDVKYDVYVYIYNGNFEECTVCEDLESAVIAAAEAAGSQNYSFFVMNYNDTDNASLSSYISGLLLPSRPALIHIQGDALATENAMITSPTSILSTLNSIRN